MTLKTLLIGPAFALANLAASAGAAAQDHGAHAHAAHATAARTAAADDDGFAALDTNRDGKLDATELAGHPLLPHLSMVDADKDGKLDKREFAAGLKML